MKTFWKYTLITLLLLVGLCAVGVLYLFFVPNAKLFKITYLSHNNEYYSSAYDLTNINEISVNSRSFEVRIIPAAAEKASVKVYSNAVGFALVKNSRVEITGVAKNGSLNFNINEPHGAVLRNSSYIEIRLPENVTANLKIKNNNATVKVDSEKLAIGNITYSANSGEVRLVNCKLNGSLDLDLNKSDFYIGETVVTNNNNVQLSTHNGLLDASTKALGEVTIRNNVRGLLRAKSCQRITMNASAGGSVDVEEVNSINLQSTDTNVKIKNLVSGGAIYLKNKGKVEIDNVQAFTDIQTNDGTIRINKADSSLMLKSGNGDIAVKSAYGYVDAVSTYGNIEIDFATDAESFATDNSSRAVNVRTQNGKVAINGVENAKITITGKGRADVNFKNVIGDNHVYGSDGSVDVKVEKSAKYLLTTKSNSGNVRVNLAQIADYTGYTDREETHTRVNMKADETVVNTLTVTTTTGDLTLLDTSWDITEAE